MRVLLRFLLALLLVAGAVRADEIRLKDGTKITGTIVGFEDGAFKVQTSYGFALVRKDQIAEIIPSAPKPAPPAPKPAAKPADTGATVGAASTGGEASPSTTSAASANSDAPRASPAPAPLVEAPATRATSTKAAHARVPSSASPSTAAGAPDSASASPAEDGSPAPAASTSTAAKGRATESKPQPIRDEIVGTLYMNHTFGFDIYKPPDWALLPDELNSLPNAVTALGTDDGTTLLLVGREARKGPLEAQAAATDAQLHDIYDNFRLLSSSNANIAGEPAIERHFRGTAEDRDWSVTVVSVAHGADLFTLLGMTYADTDLIQIQENVIARAISSLRFETP
jgi:hypothetical protein